jgi:hypothetical protein
LRTYRICILDNVGHTTLSRSLSCADDLAPLEEAERECIGHGVEVWLDARLVTRVKADNAPLDVTDRTCL